MPRRTEQGFYPEEKVRVFILNRGAYVSYIAWHREGIRYESYVDNDELIFYEEEE